MVLCLKYCWMSGKQCRPWSEEAVRRILKYGKCGILNVWPNSLFLGSRYVVINESLTLVLLNPDIPCLCKQCRARSVGFWRSQLIWICTVCHQVCKFIKKKSGSSKLIGWKLGGHGILIYWAGQGLTHVQIQWSFIWISHRLLNRAYFWVLQK